MSRPTGSARSGAPPRSSRSCRARELEERALAETLTELPGVGKVTALAITEALAGQTPTYLRRLEATSGTDLSEAAQALRQALKGDLHSHTTWSDGGSPIEEMAEAARAIGHSYLTITDHSPRLTIANGLSAARLTEQIEVVEGLRERFAPFEIRTGIEVDILADGSLDQDPALLARLDCVVASVHSSLKMEPGEMTRRMVTAVASPHVDVLGHCTGRIVKAGGSAAACARSRGSTRRSSSRRAGGSGSRWRSTPGPTGSTRPSGCCGWPTRWAACSRSTATPTLRDSSIGSCTDVSAPPCVV